MRASRLTRLMLLVAAAVGLAARLGAADPKPEEPKYGLPTPADLTPEEQARIVKAFEAADPQLRTFVRNFPSARFSMVRSDPKATHIVIATTVEVRRFDVSLVFSGIFDAGFTKAQTTRCDLFGAFDSLHELKPREKRQPLRLKLEDMDAFCREPYEFLARQFGIPNP